MTPLAIWPQHERHTTKAEHKVIVTDLESSWDKSHVASIGTGHRTCYARMQRCSLKPLYAFSSAPELALGDSAIAGEVSKDQVCSRRQ